MNMKKVIAAVLCAVIALSLTACGGKSEETKSEEGNTQIANPWTDCADIKEAVKNAGFSFEIPESIEGYEIGAVRNMGGEIIDVLLYAADDSSNAIAIRKGAGSDDISGDYNSYPESNKVTVGSREVTMKGSSGSVSLSIWTEGGYSYALTTPGMSREEVSDLILQIK